MAKNITIETFRELIDFMDFPSTEETKVTLPGPYGPKIVSDSGMTKTHVFVTKFAVSDVSYFLKLLQDNPPPKHRDDLDYRLKSGVQDWCRNHPGESPYEPFLWALKITDNYVGASIQSNAFPQPWIIDDIGDVLVSVWDRLPETNLRVLSNVLKNWDWYQPVHVMLYLYSLLSTVNDDSLDQCIRDHWLHRALYSTSALKCLCEKRKSTENIHALLQFVSQDRQTDLNEAEIQITRGMRSRIADYLKCASDEEYQQAKTYYEDVLFNCSKHAREFFNGVFQLTPSSTPEIISLIKDWEKGFQGQDAASLKRRLVIQFKKNPTDLIHAASVSGSASLHQEIINLVYGAEYDFSMQFILMKLAQGSLRCSQYADYITKEYQKTDGKIVDEKSFVLGCAYCLIGHPEIIDQLVEAHFLRSVGEQNGFYIFGQIRLKYSIQFKEQVSAIVNICLNDKTKAVALISSCSKIYSRKNATLYPVRFDSVSDMLLKCVLEDEKNNVRYANVLITLYEHVATSQNRHRYKNQLQDLIGTKSVLLESVRKRAVKKMDQLYRAI